jgi:hypothetical protein
MLYEETCDDEEFNRRCCDVAARTSLYPEFVSLLRVIKSQSHVGAVIVILGLRRSWEEILHRDLSEKVRVTGGGRISDRFHCEPVSQGGGGSFAEFPQELRLGFRR